jgi:hypothetical protein
VDAHIFTKQAEKFKQMSACQKADGNCFLEEDNSIDSVICSARDHNNVTTVSQNIKKTHRAI